MIYTNPRMRAVINDWPSGSRRVMATFLVEQNAKGERAVRITTGAAKKLTYAVKVRIVDGDDGRTYIAELTVYGHISIMRGDMKIQQETFFPGNPGYASVLELFAKDEGLPVVDVCIAGNPAINGVCGAPGCVCGSK